MTEIIKRKLEKKVNKDKTMEKDELTYVILKQNYFQSKITFYRWNL